nr:hypothetical protein GCM10020185_84350 [Pseudomonas brassicacearum subsp. brassicacearum]
MFFARLSIQWRITLLSGLCLLAVVGALTGASLYQNQQGATLLKQQSSQLLGRSALEGLQAQAMAHGQRVERFFSAKRRSMGKVLPSRSCNCAPKRGTGD